MCQSCASFNKGSMAMCVGERQRREKEMERGGGSRASTYGTWMPSRIGQPSCQMVLQHSGKIGNATCLNSGRAKAVMGKGERVGLARVRNENRQVSSVKCQLTFGNMEVDCRELGPCTWVPCVGKVPRGSHV
jgi:hypothetical protein